MIAQIQVLGLLVIGGVMNAAIDSIVRSHLIFDHQAFFLWPGPDPEPLP